MRILGIDDLITSVQMPGDTFPDLQEIKALLTANSITWADDITGIVRKNDYRNIIDGMVTGHNVVSYELELGKGFANYGFVQNPTFGWFGVSQNTFPITHDEQIICLNGILRFDIGQGIKEFTKGQKAIIPSGINLKYNQKQQALYVCEYR